jgi:hypothetical protein
MKILILIVFGLLPILNYSHAQSCLWAKSGSGSISQQGNSISTDANGNVFVAGSFDNPTITFGTTTLTNAGGGGSDIFIVKYDASGNILWAKSAGTSGYEDNVYSISTDANGNIFAVGMFDGHTITFGSTTLTNNGYRNTFIVKYDASGNILWAKSAGGIGYDYGDGISTDGIGNVFVTGHFESPTITFGTTTLMNAGDFDVFIAKYDPSGNVSWAESVGGHGLDYLNCSTSDASGNIVVTGGFRSDTIHIGATTLTNATGSTDIFIAKYDSSGNVLWAKSAGGGSYDDAGYSISIDVNGNVLGVGSFGSPAINFGSTVLTNKGTGGNYDIFIVKYDP